MMPDLKTLQKYIAENCTDCGACRIHCAFLKKHGTPRSIARGIQVADSTADFCFECSLCGLCTAVCPDGLDPARLFLEMRRKAWQNGAINQKRYTPILRYEQLGNSSLLSWYGLTGGETVFFPGCTLSGTRPETVWQTWKHIRKQEPDAGMVLACCNKPSHDLGRQEFFLHRFAMLRERLVTGGVKRVLVACPNCHKVFSEYGKKLDVLSVYEFMAERGMDRNQEQPLRKVTLHDPCPLRNDPGIHASVRKLALSCGLEVHEMKHRKKKTYCCGEGGSVSLVKPEFAHEWTRKRLLEAGKKRLVTYCAGCAGLLSSASPTEHLLDILFTSEGKGSRRERIVSFPWTYLARIRLKQRLKRFMKHEKRPR